MTRTKSEMADVIKAEATFCASVGIKGSAKIEYKRIKAQVDASLVARANANAKGEITLTSDSLKVEGSVELDVTIRANADVNIDVLDVLQLEAGIEGIAGALANAGVQMEVSRAGVKVDLSAEAFVGAKISGQIKSTLTLDGRELASAQCTGTAMAGVGVSGNLNFKCGLFGNVSFGAKAGASIGVGAEAGLQLSVDPHNMQHAAEKIFYDQLDRIGFKNGGRKWLLPLSENDKMARKYQKVIGEMMVDLYKNNEAEIKKLEAWKSLEKRVVLAMQEKHPELQRSAS